MFKLLTSLFKTKPKESYPRSQRLQIQSTFVPPNRGGFNDFGQNLGEKLKETIKKP